MLKPNTLNKTPEPLSISPDWPASSQVRAYSTTRFNGYSRAPYASFNLGAHVGDNPEQVKQNRQKLIEALELPDTPSWLNQVHGTHVVELHETRTTPPDADASVCFKPNIICAVLTADCLPILLCDQAGERVAAVHAGWRGLLSGVIDQTLEKLNAPGETLLAWLGPAIGPQAFGINEAIRQEFIDADPAFLSAFQTIEGQWHGDLYALARIRLEQYGVTRIFGGEFCTNTQSDQFFSYRAAENNTTGRMASLIWIASR